HRAHASVDAVPKLMDSYAGFQLRKEVEALSKVTKNPKTPVVAIIGGKKVSDKIRVLENMLKFVDVILVGGGSADVFLAGEGYNIGKSFAEEDWEEFSDNLMYEAEQKGIQVLIPDDVFVVKEAKENAPKILKDVADLEDDDIIVDIGVETIEKFIEPIKFAGTIVWNGPLGYFEIGGDRGNHAIAKAVAESGAYSVIGGGETISSIPENLKENFSYISTAGGATLDFLAGERLPGVEAVS
ncbi:MAG: Phosphoglycerate kinase, partial [candidate division CPR2 bacterium GW2011_GWD1_39_7]